MEVSLAQIMWEICIICFSFLNIFINHIRDIKDPEHPYSLEELKVISEDAIEVDDHRSYVRYKNSYTPSSLLFLHLYAYNIYVHV